MLDRSHDETAELQLEIESSDCGRNETIDIAVKAFEISQSLREKWVTADVLEKRQILEIVFFNCVLDDVTLCPTIRKPFDVLAEGLISKNSRDDKTAIELFQEGVGELLLQLSIAPKLKAQLASFIPIPSWK